MTVEPPLDQAIDLFPGSGQTVVATFEEHQANPESSGFIRGHLW